jgi:hypothetical protein
MMDGGNGSRLSDIALEKALLDVEDLLQRCLIPFFLLGETARSIRDGEVISGTGIDVGVKKSNLIPESMSTLHTFTLGDFCEDDDIIKYISHGVEVRIKKIGRNYKFLENLDKVFYKAGDYSIPNPFDTYWKSRYLLK